MRSSLVHNETLGRNIRSGQWAELAVGTPVLIERALREGNQIEAIELAQFLLSEMRVVYDIYAQWFCDTEKCLLEKGVCPDQLKAERKRIDTLLRPYHRAIGRDRRCVWSEIEAKLQRLKSEDISTRQKILCVRDAVDNWRDLHDCEVDQISGLFSFVVSNFGEQGLLEMYENWVIGDWFRQRYQRFDVSKIDWNEASWLLTYLGFEGHHGHLSGKQRDGSIDFIEDEEKVTISFAPCGSGGRSMEGEERDGLPPLQSAPFHWPLLKGRHDFTWNEEGICSYCAHCCILHEKLPIENFGYPVRVTKPPIGPLTSESRCSWTVYKDLSRVPSWAYERVGALKPSSKTPLGSEHKEHRIQLAGDQND